MGNAMDFTNFKRELQTLNYAELNYLISDIMLEIKKRSYNEGMVKGMTSYGSAEEVALVEMAKSPQQIRDEIVDKAKRDVTYLIEGLMKGDYYVNFVVNREKRTTVALLRYARKYGVHKRGKAKCDPTDCFNSHIGEAIALRRALGLEVPSEYLNAPQPTEVRVGDVVLGGRDKGFYTEDKRFTLTEFNKLEGGYNYAEDKSDWIEDCQIGKIIDDSREGSEVNAEKV